MEIQCDCGKVVARLENFPKESPGRLGCYCDDCQSYAIYLQRTDILDAAGCTEVVPTYPDNFKIVKGHDELRCLRLVPNGTYRYYGSCCRSPIGNVRAGKPWLGISARALTRRDPDCLEKTFGNIRARIMGSFAKGAPAPGTPAKMDLHAVISVGPFMAKGALTGRKGGGDLFKSDKRTPSVEPTVLSPTERDELRRQFNSIAHY